MLPLLSSIFLLLCLSFLTQSHNAESFVPPSATFKFTNEGDLGFYAGEFGSTYRVVSQIESPRKASVFFYNNAPNKFTLAVGFGFIPRWVWQANRNHPVSDGATLTFGKDGNLVLANANKTVVWQTNTANKGVMGIKLLGNGNLVLYNNKGKFVWQSFDHPTDTLLAGQSLKAVVADKLVSRSSEVSSLEGKYSLLLRPRRISMYYKSEKDPSKLLQYYTMLNTKESTLTEVNFKVDDVFMNRYVLVYSSQDGATGGDIELGSVKYNNTLSFFRLDYDGNLRAYTYYEDVPDGVWTVEYVLFGKSNWPGDDEGTECQLPEKCGEFGVCHNDQCVACPSPSGLLGWDQTCRSPKLVGCSLGKNVKYYKLEGVEHFTSKYTKGEGPMKENECEVKCSKDCKCLGYFYHQESSRCWIAYDLKTLTKSGRTQHLGYIKTSN